MIESFPAATSAAAAAAAAAADALWKGLRERGAASLAATGGRSPGPVYDSLSERELDWTKVRVTLSDERWVDTASDDSNERLVRARLLRGRAAHARLLGLRGTADSPQTAAAAASATLAGWPAFDVVLLGMGEDGHIASLFPGSASLAQGLDPAAPPCIAVPEGEGRPPSQPRLSLSLARLANARLVLILAGGAPKRQILERAFQGADAMELPIRAIIRSAPLLRILWSA